MDSGIRAAYTARLGAVGAWSQHLMPQQITQEQDAVRQIEAFGYGSVWTGELIGSKDVFAHAAVVLSATERIVFGAGVANIWARHPHTMQGGRATVAAAWPERFILGIGVSHEKVVAASGQAYGRPRAHMVDYLRQMREAAGHPAPALEAPLMLAALGPKMLETARDFADGAHTYLVTVEHTEHARAILGPQRLLIPAQPVVLSAGGTAAKDVARRFIANYLNFPNYVANLRRMGFDDDDFVDGGSPRLVDALVARGDEHDIVARLRDVRQAGADHVLVQPLGPDMDNVLRQFEQLGPALADVGDRPSPTAAPSASGAVRNP